jgi:hypothetical protein
VLHLLPSWVTKPEDKQVHCSALFPTPPDRPAAHWRLSCAKGGIVRVVLGCDTFSAATYLEVCAKTGKNTRIKLQTLESMFGDSTFLLQLRTLLQLLFCCRVAISSLINELPIACIVFLTTVVLAGAREHHKDAEVSSRLFSLLFEPTAHAALLSFMHICKIIL